MSGFDVTWGREDGDNVNKYYFELSLTYFHGSKYTKIEKKTAAKLDWFTVTKLEEVA
jgi:hypothetical protein